MQFDIITAFPNAFSFLSESIPKRAQEKEKITVNIHDLRKFTDDKWKKIDDRPYGGGAGMVLMVEPLYKALKELGVYPKKDPKTKVILMGARGETWNQKKVEEYSGNVERIVLICGHYEGVDNRVVEHLIDEEISVGNYILSGGELASMIIVDSIARIIPGVVGKSESVERETEFHDGYKLAEYPNYTRPETFKTEEGEEWSVPEILLSGHHAEIEKWKGETTEKVTE